jgi:hypothetical protein
VDAVRKKVKQDTAKVKAVRNNGYSKEVQEVRQSKVQVLSNEKA